MNPVHPAMWDKLFDKVYGSLRIGLFRTDLDGRLLDADSGLLRLLNYPDLDSLKESPLFANRAILNDTGALNRLDQRKDSRQWQALLQRQDSSLVRVEITLFGMYGPGASLIGYEGSLQDISEQAASGSKQALPGAAAAQLLPGGNGEAQAELERQQILKRLESSERRFRALIENSADGLTVIDARGYIRYTSPSSNRIAGLAPEQLYGKHMVEWVHPEDWPKTRSALETILNAPGKSIPFLFRSPHQDGSWRWLEGSASNLLNEPAVQGLILNFRDVTEQRRTTRRMHAGEKELLYRAEFEQLVLGISTRLINIRPEQMIEALEKALQEVGEFTHVDRCQLFLFSADYQTMNCIAEWRREGAGGPAIEKLQNLPAGFSAWWLQKMRANEVLYISSHSELPPEAENLREAISWLEDKSLTNVPIFTAGRLAGILALGSVHQERQWSEDELRLQQLLAEIIANVLEKQAAETRISQQLTNLAALHKIGKAITSKNEIGSVMNVVLEQVTTQLGMDAAVILLYDPLNRSLYFGSGRGFKPGRATTALRYMQNPLLEKVVAGREMIHMPIPEDWMDIWGNEGLTDYFGVPLIAKGEVNGVLELYRRKPMEPSDDWLGFMYMVAETAAIAIDNVSLYQKEQRAKRELEQAYDSTLESWARMLELSDQETEQHSKRVVDWTLRLARLMGMEGDMLVHLRRGALLHDIGKIFIASEIFKKTGALSLDEWQEIKKHPEYAYRLLSPIQFLRPALDIVYCHHEWWDGSGYPRALKAEEIPLAARIFTVVDVWDALTQERAYRLPHERKWEKRRAMEYLRDQAGKKFDPRVVQAFLHMLESDYR